MINRDLTEYITNSIIEKVEKSTTFRGLNLFHLTELRDIISKVINDQLTVVHVASNTVIDMRELDNKLRDISRKIDKLK